MAATYSPRTVRIVLALIAACLITAATVLVTDGWLDRLLIAGAVIIGCAAITPPLHRP